MIQAGFFLHTFPATGTKTFAAKLSFDKIVEFFPHFSLFFLEF